MEANDLAKQILTSSNIEDKLFTPDIITDEILISPLIIDSPARSIDLEFKRREKKEKLPKNLLHIDENRAVCLHRFAGHELLAVEVMAYALLAFPDAPKNFRKGLIRTLLEEQEHVRLYQKALGRFGKKLGDYPLYKHFWRLVPHLNTLSSYVSVMSLTLEMANLDFAPYYGSIFEKVGDIESSNLMKQIFADEIKHVAFGYGWLKMLKNKEDNLYDAWLKSLPIIVEPKRAKGPIFIDEGRIKAGLPDDFIENLRKL
jgi:uncharacterized ferritin-like protein (DUF455 family)